MVTIRGLLERGAQVVAHDPVAIESARDLVDERVQFASGHYEGLEGADALLIHTEWHLYHHPDFERIRALMNKPLILDGRNLYDPVQMAELGFRYICIGRSEHRNSGE